MALNESKEGTQAPAPAEGTAPASAQPAPAAAEPVGGTPLWVVPLYVCGLILLFVGQRILVEYDRASMVTSGLGIGALLFATLARFAPGGVSSHERKRIERLLALLSVGGVLAMALYFASSDWGLDHIGLIDATRKTRDQVQGVLHSAWVVIACLSIAPMLFAEAALYPMRRGPQLEARRVIAAAASGATLALAASYGALFVYTASKAEVQADFSYFKTSDPGESTIKMVKTLDEPLKVSAFFPDVSEIRRELSGYFAKLGRYSDKLQFSLHDRYLEPKLAQELQVSSDGMVVVQKGEAKRVIVIGTDLAAAQPKLKTWDKDFQALLYKVIRSHKTAYFTVGHAELNDERKGIERSEGRTAQMFKQIIQQQNFITKNLGLTDGLGSKIPDDAGIVIILGPIQPFAPEEIATLKRYIDGGGAVFMALDTDSFEQNDSMLADGLPSEGTKDLHLGGKTPEKPKTSALTPAPSASAAEVAALLNTKPIGNGLDMLNGPSQSEQSVEDLAALVGLKFAPAILANQLRHMQRLGNDSDNRILMTNRFSSHASVSTLSRNASQAAVVVLGASSLDKGPTAKTERIDFTLKALSGTFADANGDFKQQASTEPESVFNMSAAVAKAIDAAAAPADKDKPAGTDGDKAGKKDAKSNSPKEMRAFVVADADAVSDLMLGNFPANQMLVFDALRWLAGEESYTGEVNSEEDVRIEHSQQKDLAWFYSTILGVPGLVLTGGLFVSRRSRRSKGGKQS
ncbi:MAG TPA: Gldg family protein [Polyangiaceae bacterium]|nr:Gldg family protein [Polyangiaceae bacterium]